MGIQRGHVSFHGVGQVHVPFHWHNGETSVERLCSGCMTTPRCHLRQRWVKTLQLKSNVIPKSLRCIHWAVQLPSDIQLSVTSITADLRSSVWPFESVLDDDSAKWSSTPKRISVMFRWCLHSLQTVLTTNLHKRFEREMSPPPITRTHTKCNDLLLPVRTSASFQSRRGFKLLAGGQVQLNRNWFWHQTVKRHCCCFLFFFF